MDEMVPIMSSQIVNVERLSSGVLLAPFGDVKRVRFGQIEVDRFVVEYLKRRVVVVAVDGVNSIGRVEKRLGRDARAQICH